MLFDLSPSALGAAFAVIALLPIVISIVTYALASRRPKGFPDGPKTLPLLGNLHQLPTSKAFLKFHEWQKEYGNIIGLKFGPQNVVILNNYKDVRELFDKRGEIYSSRPESFIGNEIICPGDTHMLLVPYAAPWRKLRRCAQGVLNNASVDSLLPIQDAEGIQTLHDLLKDPANYHEHIRRYSFGVILASVFGQRAASKESPKVKALYHAQDQFTAILEPGATPPVDVFPFLKYFPSAIAPWKRWAKAIRAEQYALYHSLIDETKRNIEEGQSTTCFIAKILREQARNGLSDEQVTYLGGNMMEAGSDTTSATLLSFCLAMIQNPDMLKKCQAEVDAVAPQRSPTIKDFESLPYIRACMMETLRWRPVAAGGIPHVVTQDDVYGKYLIPKGTMLFANTWAIHNDEDEYDTPLKFMPERFLANKFGVKHTDIDPGENRRTTYAFGAGRRVCSGQRLAENSLIVNMAKLVWGFDITSDTPVDATIETGYGGGFLLCAEHFPAIFTPRSKERAAIIEKEYEAAQEFLSQFS